MNYLYGYYIDDIQKISLGSIKFLREQLESFISTYEKNILIKNEDDRKRLDSLKEIVRLLKEEIYDMLMNDPGRIIDYADDNEEYLPSYYPL